MSNLIKDYQLGSFKGGFLALSGFSTAGGASDTVSTPLATLAATATRSGGSLPTQAANLNPGSEATGFVTGAPLNKVEIRTASGLHIQDTNGFDVYGRLTVVGSTWTMTYYSLAGGTETAFTGMAASTMLTFLLPAFFKLNDYPYSADYVVADISLDSDVSQIGKRPTSQALSIVTTNAVPNLSQTPVGELTLRVNGIGHSTLDVASAVSYSGTSVTWVPANAYTLPVGANVIAYYNY